jgi:hypothetical protein
MESTVVSGNGWQDKEDKFLDKNPSSFVRKDIGSSFVRKDIVLLSLEKFFILLEKY